MEEKYALSENRADAIACIFVIIYRFVARRNTYGSQFIMYNATKFVLYLEICSSLISEDFRHAITFFL